MNSYGLKESDHHSASAHQVHRDRLEVVRHAWWESIDARWTGTSRPATAPLCV